MRHSPILLKPAVLFVNFQKGNEIHNQFLVTFSCYRFTEVNGTNYPPSRDSTPYSDFWGLSRNVCRFWALHILLFWLLTYPLRWNHASSRKKALSKMSVPPRMKCVNHLQYWSRFSLSGSLSSCMTRTRYEVVALCTIAETKICRLIYSNSPPGSTVVVRILRFFL
jgi:hypothetical protein